MWDILSACIHGDAGCMTMIASNFVWLVWYSSDVVFWSWVLVMCLVLFVVSMYLGSRMIGE